MDSVRELVSAIAPDHGWTGDWPDIEAAAARESIPNDADRFGRPEEIASAVAYLASEQAAHISGATLRVDGGHIRGAF